MLKRPVPPGAKRILVIRYRFLGDTILTVPFLRNLRGAYLDAAIDVLVGPNSGEVLQGCPYVNELIEFDTTRFHKYDRGLPKKSFWHYAGLLRQRHYDLVFVLKRSWSSAFLALLSGAPCRVGYATQGRQLLLTRGVPYDQERHEVESLLDVLRSVDIPVMDNHLESWISPEERAQIRSLVPSLEQTPKRVLIHAAAAHPDKLYPQESWAVVVRELHRLGFKPFFTGAQQDYQLYESLEQLSGVPGVNLAGKLSIRQSMSVYSFMHLSVCVDSGPAHLSAAAGTPTVSIFGPTDPERWRPFGPQHAAVYDTTLACRPCLYDKTCTNRQCLTELSPQVILDACLGLLQPTVVTS